VRDISRHLAALFLVVHVLSAITSGGIYPAHVHHAHHGHHAQCAEESQ